MEMACFPETLINFKKLHSVTPQKLAFFMEFLVMNEQIRVYPSYFLKQLQFVMFVFLVFNNMTNKPEFETELTNKGHQISSHCKRLYFLTGSIDLYVRVLTTNWIKLTPRCKLLSSSRIEIEYRNSENKSEFILLLCYLSSYLLQSAFKNV